MRHTLKKILFFTFVKCCLVTHAHASDIDSNLVIAKSTQKFSFDFNKKDNTVKIKEQISTTYQCLDFRTEIPIMEFYDDITTINDVGIYVNGKNARSIVPKYEYYSDNDIFYSDAHVCYFKLPVEKKGDGSEVNFEKTVTDPRYFTSIYFSDIYTIGSKTVSITVPKWMKVELKELNFDNKNIKKTTEYSSKDDADIITYTITNLAARQRESNSPGASYTEPHLLVLCKYADLPNGRITYFNKLDDQYAWYRSLTNKPDNNTQVLQTKALEITTGITNDLDKIKKIFYWVQDNIRYIAFENGIAGFKPEKADQVLRKKYGDCKGMAHLTKELLKAVGFDARLCWIGTNHIAYDYSTPSIAVDNHMICALLFKGKTYFLDATENYIGFNEYAERIQGRQVLIEDGDKYIYTKVPATTYLQNTDIEKSVLDIKGTDMEGTVTREWKGEEKENIFYQLNAIKKEKSKDAFVNFLSGYNKNYTIADFSTSDLTDYDKPLSVQYKMKHNNAVTAFGTDLYVDIDFEKNMADFTFDLKERVHDYWFSHKMNTQKEIQLIIPAGYTVSATPPNVLIQNEDYEITAMITKEPGKLIYTKRLVIKNPRLKKAKFEQWNKDIEKLKSFL